MELDDGVMIGCWKDGGQVCGHDLDSVRPKCGLDAVSLRLTWRKTISVSAEDEESLKRIGRIGLALDDIRLLSGWFSEGGKFV